MSDTRNNVMTIGVIDTRDMSDTRNNVMTIGVIDTRDMSHTRNNVMTIGVITLGIMIPETCLTLGIMS